MSDLQKYISKRKKRDSEFASDYEIGYEQFKLGVLLRQAREMRKASGKANPQVVRAELQRQLHE